MAVPTEPIPDIPFSTFSKVVLQSFHKDISLATVLVILFSILENPSIFDHHARHKFKRMGKENRTHHNGWISSFSRALLDRCVGGGRAILGIDIEGSTEVASVTDAVDSLAALLKFQTYDTKGQRIRDLYPLQWESIDPVYLIVPSSPECETVGPCEHFGLHVTTRPRDVPRVTLLCGSDIHRHGYVVNGSCAHCKVTYSADRETYPDSGNPDVNLRCYLNTARFMKIGQSLWCDRVFANAVVMGVYAFHASPSAYTQFWNLSYASSSSTPLTPSTSLPFKLGRKQVWQAFVQESIRALAADQKSNLVLRDGLPIEEVTQGAFGILGNQGIIPPSRAHTCDECTHAYRDSTNTSEINISGSGSAEEVIEAVGRTVPTDLGTNRGSDRQEHSRAHLAGLRRALQKPGDPDATEWQNIRPTNTQRHDEPQGDSTPRTHYFGPNRFYCVETICAPCGTVIAWAAFAKSESPTKILGFLSRVFPDQKSRPSFICIDKACLVLRTAVSNGSWTEWQKTSRFIVDTYHYINHKASDDLCRTWCNPAPANGSQPNLVIVAQDASGQPYLKRAFNTQACEQLNSWLGGFESILKRMVMSNFQWFLHVMLFYHTKFVILKQETRQQREVSSDGGDDDSETGDDGSL
ncbi:hypothetical protein DFP72DRAFT_835535 [Ephemerocybe angulata]|uniref:CxC5 like cysteine cluster associated with KDZ domain-containing protein n=1 Tax=Ephemerocybe angulata TaxID=980116 RepID=A0A8H6H5U2_9AGAR|nr:hypothetical protein DFP72DRAFT_835535 [Tulosesus angulatus]